MNSKIAESVKLASEPVALLWSDTLPDDAAMFEKGRWGCVMSLVAAAAKGKTVAFDRETYGCPGGGVGLGFGDLYRSFPGGVNGFCRFLSDGNENTPAGPVIALAMERGGSAEGVLRPFPPWRAVPEKSRTGQRLSGTAAGHGYRCALCCLQAVVSSRPI